MRASLLARAMASRLRCAKRLEAWWIQGVMPKWLDLAGYVMRARPGFQANKAGRQIDKPADELAWRYLEAHGDRAALIKADQVERVLADVQADGGDGVG